MPNNRSYDPTVLRALINSGRLRLPLSHTRTLEVIAALEGTKDWNHVAQRSDAILLKARAKILRGEINRRTVDMRLSETDAIAAIDQMLKAESTLPKEPAGSATVALA